jgi:multidrug efflux pump subunit AcrA (membrane-fusion protein)
MVIIFLILLSVRNCSHHSDKKQVHIVKVAPTSLSTTLYYSGTIQPINSYVVSSSADGIMSEMLFQYGDQIKSGETLFTIASSKFQTEYKSALMQYIKNKNEFSNSEIQLNESKFLHEHELISDDEFKMKKSAYYASQLALLQAKDVLENLLRQLNVKNINLYELYITDIDEITRALHLKQNIENLKIVSPVDGVLLLPNKGEDGNTKKINQGDMVKQGDALAVIGDMHGLSIKIKVNEMTVNQLKVGQSVTVTGIAFPDHVLNGKIIRIERQGEVSGSGLPMFNVEVIVPTLTQAQQRDIRVGMSAKVEINIQEEAKILVPIAAIKDNNGESFVEIYDNEKSKSHLALVKTGKTTLDSVAIISGLKEGDHIVIPY